MKQDTTRYLIYHIFQSKHITDVKVLLIHMEGSSNEINMAILPSGSLIFVPLTSASLSEAVSGVLLSPHEVFWHDSMIHPKTESKMLSNLYPSLQDFFVNECGVDENPPLLDYLAFLRHLSTEETPSEAAKKQLELHQCQVCRL